MLKLENLSKYYYSSSSVTCALRRINLEFNVGEFIAITGESGSGKTTLLNIISGLDSYEEGELYYNGKKTSYFDDSDWEQYRKEQIAFMEKYDDSVRIFRLSDFTAADGIRDTTDIIEKYKKGILGAIPHPNLYKSLWSIFDGK